MEDEESEPQILTQVPRKITIKNSLKDKIGKNNTKTNKQVEPAPIVVPTSTSSDSINLSNHNAYTQSEDLSPPFLLTQQDTKEPKKEQSPKPIKKALITIHNSASFITGRDIYVNNPDLSDIQFFINEEKQPVYAHKVFLISSGVKFFNEISNTSEQDITINIPDLNREGFVQYLRFIYSGKMELTENNWHGIYNVSTLHEFESCKGACAQFIKENLLPQDPNLSFSILKQNEFIDRNDSTQDLCIGYIHKFLTMKNGSLHAKKKFPLDAIYTLEPKLFKKFILYNPSCITPSLQLSLINQFWEKRISKSYDDTILLRKTIESIKFSMEELCSKELFNSDLLDKEAYANIVKKWILEHNLHTLYQYPINNGNGILNYPIITTPVLPTHISHNVKINSVSTGNGSGVVVAPSPSTTMKKERKNKLADESKTDRTYVKKKRVSE